MFRAIKEFFNYIIRYFTHYTLMQISKESGVIKSNKWYSIGYYIKFGEGQTIYIDDVKVNPLKK